MLIFSDLFFLRLFRILGNWEIPGNGAHFSSGKKVPKLNRAMGRPSFFRGVKFEVGWNFELSLGGQRRPPWDPQKPKKKIFHGEIFTPYFHQDLNLGPLVEVENQGEELLVFFSVAFEMTNQFVLARTTWKEVFLPAHFKSPWSRGRSFA